MSQQSSPKVSVVVVGHKRRQYMLRAVKSAWEQSGLDGKPELVVVKDFDDELVDSYVRSAGGKLVSESGRPNIVGHYLADGIAASSGDVISFLDDDDAFLPEKISDVQGLFKSHLGVTYFHNNHRVLDDDHRAVRSFIHSPRRGESVIPGLHAPPGAIRKAVRRKQVTNLSSVSIRRDAVVPHLDEIRYLTGGTDFLMFYLALASGGSLHFGDKVLSTYYVHRSSMRPDGVSSSAVEATLDLANAQVRTHMFGKDLTEAREVAEVADSLASQWEWLATLMKAVKRSALIDSHLHFASKALVVRPRFVCLSLPLFITETFSPVLARRLFLGARSLLEN